jgi:uncharacterized protein YbjT (DUF2867 family)
MTSPQTTISSQSAPQTALVLGITGAIGGAIAGALAKRGFAIRALARNVASRKNSFAFPVEWVEGDVLNQPAVIAAATVAELLVRDEALRLAEAENGGLPVRRAAG